MDSISLLTGINSHSTFIYIQDFYIPRDTYLIEKIGREEDLYHNFVFFFQRTLITLSMYSWFDP